MNSQVVECWNCHHKFEIELERQESELIYKNESDTNPTIGNTKTELVRRFCPHCGEANMIRIPKEK